MHDNSPTNARLNNEKFSYESALRFQDARLIVRTEFVAPPIESSSFCENIRNFYSALTIASTGAQITPFGGRFLL